MPREHTSILELVHMLIEGTKNESIKWEAESADSDSFRTNLKAGGVRLSRIFTFFSSPSPPEASVGGPFLIEMLDSTGRCILQFSPRKNEAAIPALEELFELAKNKALNLDQTIGDLVEEIRKYSKKQ